MAKDPAFLFYPGDYLKDTQCLSEKSQVAYDRIMCEHMRNICEHMSNITVSKVSLNFFTKRLTEDEKTELMRVLQKSGDGYQIEWVAESISKRKSYTISRAKNRSSKPKNISSSYVPHMENANENEDVNNNGKENGNFFVPEMFEIFKKAVPNYPGSKTKDYKPLLSIAQYFCEVGGLTGSAERHREKVIEAWKPVCLVIAKDKFYATKSLLTISNHIQEILQNSTNGKQGNLRSQVQAEFERRNY